MIFDMHTHTIFSSCSRLDVDHLIETAWAAGLDGICITDHKTMDVRRHIREGLQPNGIIVIFGMEYGTPDGDFLVFGPYDHMDTDMAADDLLNHVSATGGVAVAAHPFRKERPVSEMLIRDGRCTVIESLNGRNSEIENLQVSQWRKRYSLTEIGGSDAHTPDEVGRVVTRFSRPVRSRQELLLALRRGLCRPESRPESRPDVRTALP